MQSLTILSTLVVASVLSKPISNPQGPSARSQPISQSRPKPINCCCFGGFGGCDGFGFNNGGLGCAGCSGCGGCGWRSGF